MRVRFVLTHPLPVQVSKDISLVPTLILKEATQDDFSEPKLISPSLFATLNKPLREKYEIFKRGKSSSAVFIMA